MTRWWLAGSALALAGLAAAAPAIQNAIEGGAGEAPILANESDATQAAARKAAPQRPALPVGTGTATPMAERVATVGLLNKRNGLWRDLRLKPGQGVRIGDAIVKVRACDQTEPWEKDQLTGAFVQLIVRGADDKWRKVFSGWLYKETPSLNVVEHPIYDVWTKACAMRHPDFGPDTVSVTVTVAPSGSGASKAKKSPSSPEPDTAPETAVSSNAT